MQEPTKKLNPLISAFNSNVYTANLVKKIVGSQKQKFFVKGLRGAAPIVTALPMYNNVNLQIVVLPDKEEAIYFANDLESLFAENNEKFHNKKVLLFTDSFRQPYDYEKIDNSSILLRTEVLKRITSNNKSTIVVTFPEAIAEKVVEESLLKKRTIRISKDEKVDFDFLYDLLAEYNFKHSDFVIEPGQMAVRGGIIDVFSYNNDLPYRIEFSDDKVMSIRSYDPETQISVDLLDHITIISNLQSKDIVSEKISLFSLIPQNTIVWIKDANIIKLKLEEYYNNACKIYAESLQESDFQKPEQLFCNDSEFLESLSNHTVVEFGSSSIFENTEDYVFDIKPQPVFNKLFERFLEQLIENTENNIKNYIVADSQKQLDRISNVLEDMMFNRGVENKAEYSTLLLSYHQGFISTEHSIACFTDHQFFERYHKYKIQHSYDAKKSYTLKEILSLKPGDFVTHIDHGIGIFDGLEKIDNNGKLQEAIRILYKDNDILYVSIHSLHRISKYAGQEGVIPKIDKLGSNNWARIKNKTKGKVKDLARDLIKLYAQRRAIKGFAYSPDSYLQHELEASFIYEDTPDQLKATEDVKKDMESAFPMDRLICGDVGFGKTEIAIRAAFKAVADSKQVAVVAPTTILTVQHYNTFKDRLKDLPCNVDFINRFKSKAKQTETLKDLESGKVDIIIGTHRLFSKDIKFKDLGLLIIDEEQKFGVSHKEKLKKMKANVDTLTLSATPIPRTLQFSLMGARDLSIINTPPPNRYPIHTEILTFDEKKIKEAIQFELNRGGQVFFVNNRIQNLEQLALMINKLVPKANVAIGHGQMEGKKLEKIMLDFINGDTDVLVSTTIIESGIDIPNANTIIINDAYRYGLSDLHQLRGRVGRSNVKAFCYLLAPPSIMLTDNAQKRLKTIEEFSEIGSGFNIAMRDLDIRGAGNILGAEQSGFITDIGFEMYQKILDEAIDELKIEEFSDVFEEEGQKTYVRDCTIETDLELLIPDWYITNINERLSIYQNLNSCKTDQDLETFKSNITDRFGEIPPETQSLILAVKMRQIAASIGVEKVIIKNNKLDLQFVGSSNSDFYNSEIFTRILNFVKQNVKICSFKQIKDRINLGFKNVNSVQRAIEVVNSLSQYVKSE
ncbi:MAG: transcription-repair coupling factor [Bacteroidales bacterium]